MATVAVIACLFCLPQLRVEPTPAEVGQAVAIVAGAPGNPAAGVQITVAVEGDGERVLGVTAADGRLAFVPDRGGMHVFAATVAGVRCVAPVPIRPARHGWWLAIASVPLGLALLWINVRRLASRAQPVGQVSTRST